MADNDNIHEVTDIPTIPIAETRARGGAIIRQSKGSAFLGPVLALTLLLSGCTFEKGDDTVEGGFTHVSNPRARCWATLSVSRLR
jgi:hypothetical protein